MKIGEKRRKKRKIKILTTLSLLTIAGVSLMSYEKTNLTQIGQNLNKLNAPDTVNLAEPQTYTTREWIDVEPMVVSGYNFGAALKADRNSLDMGK